MGAVFRNSGVRLVLVAVQDIFMYPYFERGIFLKNVLLLSNFIELSNHTIKI